MVISGWSSRSMISTVVSSQAGTDSLTAVAVVGFIILLAIRELADTEEAEYFRVLSRNLMVFAGPMFVVFVSIVAMACLRIIA
jgi:hypothetical protein